MSSWRATRIVLYAGLIFIAGAISGAFVAPRIGRTFMRPPNPQQMSENMMDHLKDGLALTPDQIAKIKPIIDQTANDMETIRRDTTKDVLRHVAQTNAKISAVLTPEQQAKFVKMEKEHRERLRERYPFARPPGPPPPPPPND